MRSYFATYLLTYILSSPLGQYQCSLILTCTYTVLAKETTREMNDTISRRRLRNCISFSSVCIKIFIYLASYISMFHGINLIIRLLVKWPICGYLLQASRITMYFFCHNPCTVEPIPFNNASSAIYASKNYIKNSISIDCSIVAIYRCIYRRSLACWPLKVERNVPCCFEFRKDSLINSCTYLQVYFTVLTEFLFG